MITYYPIMLYYDLMLFLIPYDPFGILPQGHRHRRKEQLWSYAAFDSLRALRGLPQGHRHRRKEHD